MIIARLRGFDRCQRGQSYNVLFVITRTPSPFRMFAGTVAGLRNLFQCSGSLERMGTPPGCCLILERGLKLTKGLVRRMMEFTFCYIRILICFDLVFNCLFLLVNCLFLFVNCLGFNTKYKIIFM